MAWGPASGSVGSIAQTVSALAELDDRILADIGVARLEIEKVAWTMSREAL
jgi:uncharacterized protein YjiS (DUF1127 family)